MAATDFIYGCNCHELQGNVLYTVTDEIVYFAGSVGLVLEPNSRRQVCCSVLQCVAVCCCVLQCVAVCVGAQFAASGVSQCVAVWCSVLQCAAVWCSVCCSVLQL